MSTFLRAALKVLGDRGEPLSARAITDEAIRLGLLATSGKTPAQTMKAKLSTDILRSRERSLFMRTKAGEFGLRRWVHSGQDEYVADRYVKALLHEDAIVIPAERRSRYAPSPGLWPLSSDLGLDLLQHTSALERSVAETRTDVIQLVSGFVVQHGDTVLTYKRTRRLPESRLHGEYSLLFGGHLNPNDISPLFNLFDPAHARLMERELREELRMETRYDMRLRGLLYDDKRDVSRQHLAVVFDVFLEEPIYQVGERGFLQQDKFESWDEVRDRLADFENWSQLLYRIYAGEGRS